MQCAGSATNTKCVNNINNIFGSLNCDIIMYPHCLKKRDVKF